MANIGTSISNVSLNTIEGANDILKLIPQTAYPTTEITRATANIVGESARYSFYNSSTLIFYIDVTSPSGDWTWEIFFPTYMLQENDETLLQENSDGLINED